MLWLKQNKAKASNVLALGKAEKSQKITKILRTTRISRKRHNYLKNFKEPQQLAKRFNADKINSMHCILPIKTTCHKKLHSNTSAYKVTHSFSLPLTFFL